MVTFLRTRLPVFLMLLLCLTPVIAAYSLYFVVRPQGGSTNYGYLVKPQRPVPDTLLVLDRHLNTQALARQALLQRKWWLLSVGPAACDGNCLQKLYYMRQVRAAQGVGRERIEMVWLRTGDDAASEPVPEAILQGWPDLMIFDLPPAAGSLSAVRASGLAALNGWLGESTPESRDAALYLVDPNGHLMMRFPKNPDAGAMKRDLTKLLKWSGTG